MLKALQAVWANPYVRVGVLLLVAVALFYLLTLTRMVWSSLLIAYLLAYLLHPLADWIEGRRLHRGFSVLVVVFLILGLLGLLWLLGIKIAAQLSIFATQLPGFIESLRELPFRISRLIDPEFGSVFQQVFINLQRVTLTLTNQVLPSLETAGQRGELAQRLVGVLGGGFQVAIILVMTAYLLYSFPVYMESVLKLFPERYRPTVLGLSQRAGFAIGSFMRAQLLISLIIGVLTWLGMTIVGVPLALALAVIAAIGNLIPFLGPILTAVPTVILALTVGLGHAVAAGLVLLAINQLDAHIITPMILSRSVPLDPVTVIVALLLGAALFGLWGAILAVPVAAFLKLIYTDYYLKSRWYRSAAEMERLTTHD